MHAGQIYVGQIYVDEIYVGQIYVGQMHVGQIVIDQQTRNQFFEFFKIPFFSKPQMAASVSILNKHFFSTSLEYKKNKLACFPMQIFLI
jgi:hypothetical protein